MKYCNISYNEELKKKDPDFGKVWGAMPKTKANATFTQTGNGLTVVDVDRKDNMPTILEGIEPTVETARGYHYYFTHDPKLKFKSCQNHSEQGVDIKGEGGALFTSYWGDDDRISYKKIGNPQKLIKEIQDWLPIKTEREHSERSAGNSSKKEVKAALALLDVKEFSSREEWMKVLAAIYDGLGSKGRKIATKWSMGDLSNFDQKSFDSIWDQLEQDKYGEDITVGTLLHLAYPQIEVEVEEGEALLGKSIPKAEAPKSMPKQKHKEWWEREKLLNAEAIWAYLHNTGWDVKRNGMLWVSSSGSVREFKKIDAHVMFKDIKAVFSPKKRSELETRWLTENEEEDIGKFYKAVWAAMTNWIIFNHQYTSLRVKVDPWAKPVVTFYDRTMTIITNETLPKEPKSIYNETMVADYKEHFPDLDIFLDLMLAGRFGADRKEAYLWLKAISNWGKSFLFSGIMQELGICTFMTEKELKLAMSGSPVGLNGEDFTRSWFTVFEEFRGAVAELKNITHTLTLSPKMMSRVEVDLYFKIFLSAESVNSLTGDGGIEKQFSNRFMMMEAEGDLSARKLYRNNQLEYIQVIRRYVFDYFKHGVKAYVKMSKQEAAKVANKVLHKYRKQHLIEADDLMETVADMRSEFYKEVKFILSDKEIPLGYNNEALLEFVKLHFLKIEGGLYMKRIGKVREFFLKEYFGDIDLSKLKHKSTYELLNIRGKTHVRPLMNVYKLL